MRGLSFELLLLLLLPLLLRCSAQLPLLHYNELELGQNDELDLRQVDWRRVVPLLLQRQQLRLCVAIYRHDMAAIRQTPCQQLIEKGEGEGMAYCDIGQIEDISVTMRDAFGSSLLDSMQKCRQGLEIFGLRCRRRV